MTLFKLSLSNMKKSLKDYAIYFFTLVLGVAIFYIFNAIETQTAMMRISKDTRKIVELMANIISGVSVFIAFVLGFLIIYASRFLMKRRNKEFGLYLLLGMGKWKVSKMLFIETLIIGLVSLGVGLLSGVGISQLTSLLVANMFEADMSSYNFVFSSSAFVKTCFYFAIIYVVVILFNTIAIGRCKLIDLFQSGRRSETVKMKNPWISVFVFLLSVAGLGYAYYQINSNTTELYMKDIYFCIGLGCVCTFLFFWSISGMLFRLVSSMKRVYYKGLNSFVIRQMSSRVNTNVLSISIICIMLFVTICVLTSALTIRNGLNEGLRRYATVDVNITRQVRSSDYDVEAGKGADEDAYYDPTWDKRDICDIYKEYGIDLPSMFSAYEDVYIYSLPDFTYGDTFSEQAKGEFLGDQPVYGMMDVMENVMTVSDYNRVAKLCGFETVSIKDDEYGVVANYKQMVKYRDMSLQAGTTIQVNGYELKPGMSKCQAGDVQISTQAINTGIIIVPDGVLTGVTPISEILLAIYNTTDTDKIMARNEHINLDDDPDVRLSLNTKENVKAASIGLGAIASFIGLYIGMIFLISGAAILALKELSESTDNVERYKMLRKLGVDQKMINHALFAQMGLFFLFPLALAVIHSIFGLKFSRQILSLMGTDDMGAAMLMTVVVMVVIYGGYFLITYFSGRKIISEQ